MEFSEYQQKAMRTAIYPARVNTEYPIVGLANEAGEALGKLKKVWRGDHEWSDVWEDLVAELGDCMWYIAAAARDLGVSLDLIAKWNLDKLEDRERRGVLKGSGDQR